MLLLRQTLNHNIYFPIFSPEYGATLIEHSLIEVGLSGSVKVDAQADPSQGIKKKWHLWFFKAFLYVF